MQEPANQEFLHLRERMKQIWVLLIWEMSGTSLGC